MNNIRLSVIIPCYNQAHFLEDAVKSVLVQEFTDWEIIIINDGSTDSTKEISEQLALKDNRIRVHLQTNQGLSSARNKGLSLAKGEVIHFMDADDKVLESGYKTVFNFFTNFSEIDIVVGGYSYFRDDEFLHTHGFSDQIISIEDLVRANLAPPVSYFCRKVILDKIGGFDESLKSCEDWDYWIRAGKAGARIRTVADVLVGYRYVPNSMSRNAVQMYHALKEVSFRAGIKDTKLDSELPFNKDYPIDVEGNLKYHLLRCLGVYLMQGKVSESVNWFLEEKEKWNWKVQLEDFEGMNTNLSFRYFLNKSEIEQLINNTLPDFEHFFIDIGLNERDREKAVRIVFAPQLKKWNHFRYGKRIGAMINRLTF